MTRRLRRFATALLGLLLLQTSALEGRLACLMPASAGGAMSGTAEHQDEADGAVDAVDRHAGHQWRGGPAANTHRTPPDGERQLPHHGSRQHCPSSTSCLAVAIAALTASAGDAPVHVAARIVAPRATAPSSVVRGPEPPPPRA